MKSLLLVILILPFLCFAQENDFGKVSGDTLVLKNGARFVAGEKLRFAYGSGANKTFEFITLSPWSMAGPVKLPAQWANHEMVIKKFNFEGNKKLGKKWYIVLNGGNLSPYWCDIVAAMDNGEVVIAGINDQKAGQVINAESPADELKKLKSLYDSGALTKDEYDSAKKKILAKM